MGVVTAAVIGAAGTAYAANKASGAAKKGANAQVAAAEIAANEARAAREQTRTDTAEYRAAGEDALRQMQRYLAGDTSGFENSAQYKFAVDQGFKGLNRGLTAQGAFASPAADADRIALGQGLATEYGDNWFNKQAGISSAGANLAAGMGNINMQTANSIGNAMLTGANAQAQGYANAANAYGNAANSLGQIAGGVAGYYANRPQTASAPSTSSWLSGSGSLGNYSTWGQQSFPQSNGIFMGRTA